MSLITISVIIHNVIPYFFDGEGGHPYQPHSFWIHVWCQLSYLIKLELCTCNSTNRREGNCPTYSLKNTLFYIFKNWKKNLFLIFWKIPLYVNFYYKKNIPPPCISSISTTVHKRRGVWVMQTQDAPKQHLEAPCWTWEPSRQSIKILILPFHQNMTNNLFWIWHGS
jgi:hypothetical protein